MSRIPNHKEVKFMKKFNFSKGLVIGLLTLALCLTCFAAAKVSAADAPSAVSADYNAVTNEITASGVVYVLKAEKGNTIKAGSASFSVSGKTNLADLGIKATNKDVYLYVCNKEFEEEGKNISANLVIKAQAAKKVVGVIDYTATGASPALSITATDASKKAIKDSVALVCDTIDGDYSDASSFNGTELAKYLEAGGTIYVKMKGVSSADGKPQFSSKAVKVKIAKQAKAPAVKIDVKKDSIALKNGYDFAIANGGSVDAPALNGTETWYTILPSLKTAKINTLTQSIVETAFFKPLDKKDSAATNGGAASASNKVSYTKYAVKSLTFDKLLTTVTDPGEDFVLAVRKSATSKKPASDVAYITIYKQTEAPLVYTKYNVEKQFLVATANEFAKNGFTIGTIVNYPGASGTSGYDDTFTVTEQADADTNGGNYEYLVINRADEANIDWSTAGWKKLDPAKTKITSKLKSKYTTINGTTVKKVTASLKAKANITVPNTDATLSDLSTLADTYLLIRRAGDKASGVRASKPVRLFVGQNGKTYSLYSEKSNGEEAYSYTAHFYKWTKGADPSRPNDYGWKEDETLKAIAWGKDAPETVEFPSVDNADFFEADDSTMATLAGAKTTLDVAGKFTTPSITSSSAPDGYFAIAEYANVKVTTMFGTGNPALSGFQQVTALENKTMGIIEAGKVSSYSSSAWTSGSSVAVYVGKEYTLTLANAAADTDILAKGYYIDTTVGAKLVSNANYTIPDSAITPATGIPTSVKFTVNTASETEIKVQIAVKAIKYEVAATGSISAAADTLDLVPTGADLSIPAGATVEWSSSDTDKATVSNGTVTAVADGTVTITAKVKVGSTVIKTATCTVTISNQ
jgi:hypothetical protein